MDLIEALTIFGGQFGLGMYPLPPDPGVLGDVDPDMSLIKRDITGLIMQEQGDPLRPLDGGDSAQKTGIAAFCGSKVDQEKIPIFEDGSGIMVRHPVQTPWNNWKNCSRDQLVAYSAGCWRSRRFDITRRLLERHATRVPPFTCQNTENDEPGTTKVPPIGDPMGPHDVMALRIAAGDGAAYTEVTGQFFMQCAIELADRSVEKEKNQLIVQAAMSGRLNFYVAAHPNYKDNIMFYWAGWRNQRQIGEAFISALELELVRYKGKVVVPFLPLQILEFLRNIDIAKELQALSPSSVLQLGAGFVEATLKDFGGTAIFVAKVGLNEVISQMRQLTASIDLIAKVLSDLGQAAGEVKQALIANGVPLDIASSAVKAAFPGIPHIDEFLIPHADVLAIPHADIAPIHADTGAGHTDVAGLHTDVGHSDLPAVHADGFGIDTDVTPHGDIGHVDFLSTPFVDVAIPHVDAITTPHIDTPATAHIDTPPTNHVDVP